MSLAAGVPAGRLGSIVTGGAVQLAPVYVAVDFRRAARARDDRYRHRARNRQLAAEYGGERPLALALVFCAIVAVLFTSLSGLGAMIMVGSIVLPIMMTAGVPRNDRGDALPHGLRARLHFQHRELDVLHELFRRRAGSARPLCDPAGDRGCGRARRLRASSHSGASAVMPRAVRGDGEEGPRVPAVALLRRCSRSCSTTRCTSRPRRPSCSQRSSACS